MQKTNVQIAQETGVRVHPQDIERAHRLPSKTTPRPLIAKFVHFQDKDDILKNKMRISDSNISISEDYSKLLQEERKVLLGIMHQKREEKKYATVRYNKIQIEELFRYNKESKSLIKIGVAEKPIPRDAKKRRRDSRANTESPVQNSKIGKDEGKGRYARSTHLGQKETNTNSETNESHYSTDENEFSQTTSTNRSNDQTIKKMNTLNQSEMNWSTQKRATKLNLQKN